jgi:pilus assembly protein CpaB
VLEPESRGKAINTPVVTLLVTPEQAETLTLAGNEGRIQLVLRNGADVTTGHPPGRQTADLYGPRNVKADAPVKAAPRLAAVSLPAPPPPPAVVLDQVVVIRGNQRTVEVVGATKSEGAN